MSFLENRDAISLCNKALSRVKQGPLSGSLDDAANANKSAAVQCNLWYKTIVRQVLSAHHWGLATKRVGLAYQTVNSRSGEWLYAYIPPTDMAFPVMVGLYDGGAGVSYYQGLGYILASLYGRPIFRYESGSIFSQIEGATLDYVSFDITEMDFNEAVEALVVIFLAEQLARSLAKDDTLAETFRKEGVSRMNLEIARNLNMNRPRYFDGLSDAEKARNGLDPMLDQFRY
jgi:hypothetical protein